MGKRIVAFVSVLALVSATSAWGAPSTSPALVIKPGYKHTFTKIALRPGATVRCVDHGHALSVQAPAPPWLSAGTVWERAGTRHFHLWVDVKRGDGFVVQCGLGGESVGQPVTKAMLHPK
jgi:hypothetical protein